VVIWSFAVGIGDDKTLETLDDFNAIVTSVVPVVSSGTCVNLLRSKCYNRGVLIEKLSVVAIGKRSRR
jgi:hypothetical protein